MGKMAKIPAFCEEIGLLRLAILLGLTLIIPFRVLDGQSKSRFSREKH
jgi:hypothetical protein